MSLWPQQISRPSFRTLVFGLIGLTVASVVSIGLTKAVAQYRFVHSAIKERQIGHTISSTAGFRGTGLAPNQQLSLSVIENGKTLFSGNARTDAEGKFATAAIPLNPSGEQTLLVAVTVYLPDRKDPADFSISLNPRARQISMTGSGFWPEAPLQIHFGRPGKALKTATDWVGGFATAPDAGSPLLNGSGSACIESPQPTAEQTRTFSLCFDLETTAAPGLILAATGPDGKPQKESPYSTWTPPGNCNPVDAELSVCDGGSMNQAFKNAKEIILRAFMMMTEQLTANMMQQSEIIGALIDAKIQLETQRWFREKLAESHKDYQPSDQMCRFATFSTGLNAAQQKTRVSIRALNKYMMERQTAPVASSTVSRGTGAPGGPGQDIRTRSEQFRDFYCDSSDNNSGGLTEMCRTTATADRKNKDIDFMRLVEMPLTINVDFTNGTAEPDETDILTLSKYLYSHDITQRPDNELMSVTPGEGREGVNTYQDSRSLNAVRSVARNTLAQIVGEKTPGTSDGQYMKAMMKEFSMTDTDITSLLGTNPSYFAQMEVLTRKMFQHPNFFANLYDTPVNVERQGATLQAIRLMQDRDRFEASLRREMLVAMLLEMKLRRAQDHLDQRIQGNISTQLPGGSGFSITP